MELSLEALVKALGGDGATARAAALQLDQMAAKLGAPGQEQARSAWAGQLIAAIEGLATKTDDPKKAAVLRRPNPGSLTKNRTRSALIRVLSAVAGPTNVEAIAKWIDDPDLADLARCALEAIPGKEATNALVATTESVRPDVRIGAINSLGRRGDKSALETLKEFASKGKDYEAKLNALEALANFADPSLDSLYKPLPNAQRRAANRVNRARVRLAENLAHGGYKDAAKKIFQAIASSDAEPAQQKAANLALKSLG